jgi:hypothetical protein
MRLTKHLSVTIWTLLGITTAGLVLSSTIGFGSAQAANIAASETGDVANLLGTEFDAGAFNVSSAGEQAVGVGKFLVNLTPTGKALLVLTEGPGGANSDWLELSYSGDHHIETITALWNSDADPGGLPALPTDVMASFLAETGTSQEVTQALMDSATASGFSFPSNITIQVQPDAPESVMAKQAWADLDCFV